MCAIGLTDRPSRYVIINEPMETDPLTLTHSYWPPSLCFSFMPLGHRLVRFDRVHPGMVNKSLSHTATTTGRAMGRDDLPSLSPVYLTLFLVLVFKHLTTPERCEMFPEQKQNLLHITAVTYWVGLVSTAPPIMAHFGSLSHQEMHNTALCFFRFASQFVSGHSRT